MGNSICVSKKNAGDPDGTPPLSKKKASNKHKANKAIEEDAEQVIVPKKKTHEAASVQPIVEDPRHKAPSDFKPRIAADYEGEITAEAYPISEFNGLAVSQDLTDSEREAILAMDAVTLETSARNQKNFNDLIWQLIYSRELTNDLDKVRAIFIWLATKKLNEISFVKPEPGSPEETLMKIKNREITYAEAFALLCKYAGIQCKVINGYAKGMEFVPGMKLSRSSQALHSWNAALLGDRWHLFDCHWAGRRVIGLADPITPDMLYRTVDDFFYKANPNHLMMTHHPLDASWQLTNTPLSLEEFEKLCPIKSSFFKYDLKLLSHPNGYVEHDSKQPLRIKVGYPTAQLNNISFTFSLRQEVLGEIYKTEDLSNYAIHFSVSTAPPEHAFVFRFPRSGVYNILLYVRDVSSETFSIFCEYRVEAKVPKSDSGHIPIPFPSTQQNQYGPTQVAADMGITVEEPARCVYEDVKQCVDICFRSTVPGREIPPMVAQLRGMTLDENKLSRFVLQRVVSVPVLANGSVAGADDDPSKKETGDKPHVENTLVITPFLPMIGEYSLEIYAEDENKDSNKYNLIWQFLLITNTVHDFGPLPMLPGNILGPLADFFSLGLSLISHPDPFVKIASVDTTEKDKQICSHAEIAIDMLLPPKDAHTGFPTVRVIGQLTTIGEDGEEQSLTEYILQQVTNRVLTFQIRFPKSGLYKMHIYGHALPDVNDTLPLLCTYLFYVMPRLASTALPLQGAVLGPYPKQTNKWKEGAQIFEPLKGVITKKDLNADGKLKFSMIVPRAKDVVVVFNGDDVCHLDSVKVEGSDACKWEGEVSIPFSAPAGAEDQKVCVAGRWTTQVGNYPTLLEYKLDLNN